MDKYFTSILILLAVCCLAWNVAAQQPVIQNYTTSEGLPSTAIYDIAQDELGYIWLATDNGLSKFNGVVFENFSRDDGLPDHSIIHFSEGRGDTIWCMGYNGTVSMVADGKILTDTTLNQVLARHLNSYVDKIYKDTLGRFWIAPRFGGLLRIEKDGSANWIYTHEFTGPVSYVMMKDFGDQCLMAVIDPPGEIQEDLPDFYRSGNEYYIKVKSVVTHLHRNVIKFSEGDYLISYFKYIYRIRAGQLEKSVATDQRIIDIEIDHHGDLWLSHFTEGVKKYPKCDLEAEPEIFFSSNTITRVFEDAERVLWLASANSGLFRISSFDFQVLTKGAGNLRYSVTSVDAGGGKIFISTYNQRVFEIDLQKGDLGMVRFYAAPTENSLHDILVERDSLIWILNAEHFRYRLDGTPLHAAEMESGLLIEQLSGDRVLTASQFNINIWRDGRLLETSKREVSGRILCVCEDFTGAIWIGTIRGLYRYDNGIMEPYTKYPELTDDKITAICTMKGNLVISKGKGEVFMICGDSVCKIAPMMEKGFGNINKMITERDSILWIGSDEGLIRVTLHGSDPLLYDVVSFHTGDGLSSEKINDLLIYRDMLWLGTNRGLVMFRNRHEPVVSLLPKVHITRILVNDRPYEPEGELIFSPDENNIRFEFRGVSQRAAGNINFRYRLYDHDPDRVFTQNLYAYFPNLHPGEYRFYLNAGNADGQWNEIPVSLDFKIEKPFTQTVIFLVMLIAVITLVLGVTLLMLSRFQRRRNALKQNLVLMQQRLLRSQMNPHFVFNSLLAIQSFIYKNNPKEAGRYLSRFARLIRMILNSSRKDMIPLEEELEYLEYYLDLQKLRFRNAFDYSIEVAEDIHPDRVMLPPMLAQPFIENAIEHGLRDLNHQGKINISFECNDSALIFNVVDNGIGISRAEKIKFDRGGEYESLGQRITVDRLRLLNKTHGHKVTFTIEEMKDKSGNVSGTSVSFHIRYKEGINCR